MIVHWPQGVAARGELRHNPGHLVDLVPTILELAGGKKPDTWQGQPIPAAPGRSLVPVFASDNSVVHDYLWWYHSGNRALRVGDWKLVSEGEKGPWELYDLSTDRCESIDLADDKPFVANLLAETWEKYLAEFRQLAEQQQ